MTGNIQLAGGHNVQGVELNVKLWQRCYKLHRLVLQKRSIRKFAITEKAPTRAFSWLKATTTAYTFKTLLRHYAKRALTQRSLNVKLGPRRKSHKGRAV